MTEIEPLPCASAWYGRVAWRSRCALLIGVGATLFFFNLGARVLSTNDEARFPMLARDILSQGHWLLPRLDGIPHLNKPPLHAWLIALASWPTGAVTPWTACVPSVFAGLAVVGATYWIARRLFDRETALVAGLTVLTTQGVFVFAREPMPDMTFCAALTGALAAYVAAEVEGRRWALVAFYGLIGIAFWTKGPAGLLPLAVVAVDLGVTDGAAGLRRIVSAPGLLILVLLVGAWGGLILAAPNAERFASDVVKTDLLAWYLPTKGLSWRQLLDPPLQALAILLPWSVALPGALWAATRSAEAERVRRLRLLLVWLGVMFVLVAITREQRMRYYLPLCPPAALLIAAWYRDLALPTPRVGFHRGLDPRRPRRPGHRFRCTCAIQRCDRSSRRRAPPRDGDPRLCRRRAGARLFLLSGAPGDDPTHLPGLRGSPTARTCGLFDHRRAGNPDHPLRARAPRGNRHGASTAVCDPRRGSSAARGGEGAAMLT